MERVIPLKKRTAIGTPVAVQVQALADYRLRIHWSDGTVRDVDVGDKLRCIPAFAPILQPEVFATVRIADGGTSIEWLDTEFGADNVWAWTLEQAGQISHERIWNWMHQHRLTVQQAADALRLSVRMLAYYRSGAKPVPYHIWLACVGYDALQSGFVPVKAA